MNIKLSVVNIGDGVHYTSSPMYKAFLPLLYSLKLGGMYHERDAIRKSKRLTSCSQFYSFLVTIALWAAALITVYPLKNFTSVNPTSFGILNSILLYFQCAVNVGCLLSASYSEKGWKKFFISFSSLDKYGGVYTDSNWFKKVTAVFCFITWLLFIIVSVFSFLLLFSAPLQSSAIALLLNSVTDIYYLSRVLTLLSLLYLSFCWLFMNCLLLLIGVLVYKECKLYRVSFSTKSNQLGCSHMVFENERKRFIEITRIVKAADSFLGIRNASALSFNVINICVLLYILIYNPDVARDQENFPTYFFGIVMCLSDIVIVCISGILVISGVSNILPLFFF